MKVVRLPRPLCPECQRQLPFDLRADAVYCSGLCWRRHRDRSIATATARQENATGITVLYFENSELLALVRAAFRGEPVSQADVEKVHAGGSNGC